MNYVYMYIKLYIIRVPNRKIFSSMGNNCYCNEKIDTKAIFRENTKMLMVLTDNIIDQNHFGNIIRTSLSNSRNSFGSI